MLWMFSNKTLLLLLFDLQLLIMLDSILKSAFAEAALQDQFQQSCQRHLDRKHLQEMNMLDDKIVTGPAAKPDFRETKKILAGLSGTKHLTFYFWEKVPTTVKGRLGARETFQHFRMAWYCPRLGDRPISLPFTNSGSLISLPLFSLSNI